MRLLYNVHKMLVYHLDNMYQRKQYECLYVCRAEFGRKNDGFDTDRKITEKDSSLLTEPMYSTIVHTSV